MAVIFVDNRMDHVAVVRSVEHKSWNTPRVSKFSANSRQDTCIFFSEQLHIISISFG